MLFASFIIMFKKSQIILVTKDHRKKKARNTYQSCVIPYI